MWYDVTWCDVIWFDMMKCDVMWYDMISYEMMWYDVIWYDVIWYDIIWYWCDMMWYDTMWYIMIWCDMMWCDMMWHDVMWYDVTWCDVMNLLSNLLIVTFCMRLIDITSYIMKFLSALCIRFYLILFILYSTGTVLTYVIQSTCLRLELLSIFLSSSLLFFLPSFFPSFLPSFLHSFLSYLPSFFFFCFGLSYHLSHYLLIFFLLISFSWFVYLLFFLFSFPRIFRNEHWIATGRSQDFSIVRTSIIVSVILTCIFMLSLFALTQLNFIDNVLRLLSLLIF